MHLVIIGLDEIVINKYMYIVFDAIREGALDGYYIFDLESQRQVIENKVIQLDLKPKEVFYLNDAKWKKDFVDKIKKISNDFKVYIATEARWHYFYLEWCIKNEISALVEKPIFVFNNNDTFEPEHIVRDMEYLLRLCHGKEDVSVMTLGRYHKIYNDILLKGIGEVAIKYNSPITSIHLRHAGGVWNIMNEYDERDDHPYRYGYGMIMHGGYHYIDLIAQSIEINKKIVESEMVLELSAFSARPDDQEIRISSDINALIGSKSEGLRKDRNEYGETDIVASFRLFEKDSRKTITLGTIALEQTTQSIRNWNVIPDDIYNKNGRVSSVDFEVQVSILASDHVTCYDVPVVEGENIDRIDACADIIKRRNANVIDCADFVSRTRYTGVFHSDSNKKLMSEWIYGTENRSGLKQHITVVKLLYLLCMASRNEGEVFRIDI